MLVGPPRRDRNSKSSKRSSRFLCERPEGARRAARRPSSRLGLDPVRVSKIAGHANVSVTLNAHADEFDKAMYRDDLIARINKSGFGTVEPA